MRSNIFKRRLQSNNFDLEQFSTAVKSFITKPLEYKAVLNLKTNLYALPCISE